MRTLKDRVISLIEFICGKDESDVLFNEEKISLVTGKLISSPSFGRSFEDAMFFSYGEIPFGENGYRDNSLLDNFRIPLHNIDNDESKILQVYVLNRNMTIDKHNIFKDRETLYNDNKDFIDEILKLMPENPNVIVRYIYEEFEGVVKQYSKIKFSNHNSWPRYEFSALTFDLANDNLFLKSFSTFLATYFGTYITEEDLKDDFYNILRNLPPMVSKEELEIQQNRPLKFNS